MYEELAKSRKRSKRAQAFLGALRSCSFCESNSGIEVSNYNRRNDIVSCQVCGASFLLQSLKPLRLQPLEIDEVQDLWDEDDY